MLFDLNEILVEGGKDKKIEGIIPFDFVDLGYTRYEFKKDNSNRFSITFENKGNKKVSVTYKIDAVLMIPCDRCLELVEVPISASDSKDLDLKKNSDEEEFEFIEGFNFNLDVFLSNEILIDLPMKTLCSEDCKGICKKCGMNRNKGSCDCDTTELDPRMSKILDVFNQFKEV